MKRLIMITILLGIIALISSCTKKCWIAYEFEVPHSIYPKNDTISVGDTLWLEANFSSTLIDHRSGNNIDISTEMLNWDEDILIFISEIVSKNSSLSSQEIGIDKFGFVNIKGELFNPSNITLRPNHTYDNSTYSLMVGLIPKEKGLFNFRFGFDNLLPHNKRYEINVTDTKCKEELIDLYFKVNEQIDGTFDTNWEIAADNTSHEVTENLKRTTYTFVVK